MNKVIKIVIVVSLFVVVSTVLALKQFNNASAPQPVASANQSSATITESSQDMQPVQTAGVPRLVDLGADKCIPCKMMAPILEELKVAYKGKLQVDFIDVWKNPDEARKSGISIIPTQIFYDASGKELFRHEGFFSKEDILAKWKEFGVNL
ncbi:MAG: thioredoxin family protein [Sedimentisphaerales bacterium]